MTFQSQTLFVMVCVLILPWFCFRVIFVCSRADGLRASINLDLLSKSQGCQVCEWNCFFWLISLCHRNPLYQVLIPCIAAMYDPVQPFTIFFCQVLAIFVLVSHDQKAACLILFIFRRRRVGNNSLPEKKLALKLSKYNHLLNLLILFFFLYMELLFSYCILSDLGCSVIFEFSHSRTVFQAFEHFLFTICRRVLGFDPVTTRDVLKLAHTFIYCGLDYCDSCQTSCTDTSIKRICWSQYIESRTL